MQVSDVSYRHPQEVKRSQAGPRTAGRMLEVPHGTRFRTPSRAERLAQRLGWFSIVLGAVEVLAPGLVARLCGGHARHTGLVRLYGVREIATGLLIFSEGRRPVTGMWARVAGDVIDLATLGVASTLPSTHKGGVLFAAANVAMVTALDVDCARQLEREEDVGPADDGTLVTTKSVVINRPPDELYRFWRDVENFPRFMLHLDTVRRTGERTSHWIAKGPAGGRVEWESEIVEDVPNQRIAWRSLPGARTPNAGAVTFEPRPDGRGTIVRVEMVYAPPGGRAGEGVAKLFNQSPEQQLYDDLRRLKQVIETGEVVRSDGSPEGAGQVWQRPAQPVRGPARIGPSASATPSL